MTGKDAGAKKNMKSVMDDGLHALKPMIGYVPPPPDVGNALWVASTSGVHYANAPTGSQTYAASSLGM